MSRDRFVLFLHLPPGVHSVAALKRVQLISKKGMFFFLLTFLACFLSPSSPPCIARVGVTDHTTVLIRAATAHNAEPGMS